MTKFKCFSVLVAPVMALLLCWLTSCNPVGNRGASSGSNDSADLFASSSINQFGLHGTKTLALTFDDGPGAGTAEILDTLATNQIRATFFVLGRSAKAFPDLMARIQNEGHIVASHTYAHETLTGGRYRGGPMVVNNLLQTHNVISYYQNPNHGKYFRAPGGAWPGRVAATLNVHPVLGAYVGPIFWDIGGSLGGGGAADWSCWKRRWSVSKCLQGYLNETAAKQGGVVLFHDITTNSASMVQQYISILIEQGYRFVTLDDLPSLSHYR
jgi:peptidoglycan/xylan/chitin deacetylase (PgdA/CDA1 family)